MTRQYYHRNNKCQAANNKQFNCSCWHDIGTGPLPELTEDVCKTYFFPGHWRDKPEPPWTAAVWPEDVLPEDSLVGRILNPEPTFTAEEAEVIAAPWSYLEPPATVEPMPPLLRAMTVASGQLLDATLGDATPLQCWAAEIEALRDMMLPEEPEPTTGGCLDQRRAIWRRDNQIRTWLTEQARIARGEP